MRISTRERWLQRAYALSLENECEAYSVDEYIEMLMINPTTGRVSADIPLKRGASQWLSSDKRFASVAYKRTAPVGRSVYEVLLYYAVVNNDG